MAPPNFATTEDISSQARAVDDSGVRRVVWLSAQANN
jgi:hypothetical protein